MITVLVKCSCCHRELNRLSLPDPSSSTHILQQVALEVAPHACGPAPEDLSIHSRSPAAIE